MLKFIYCLLFSLTKILQTYTGSILVAVNPYKDIDIYSSVSKEIFIYLLFMNCRSIFFFLRNGKLKSKSYLP